MFKNIIARTPSKSMKRGLTTVPESGTPDYRKALEAHKKYLEVLESLGCTVDLLPPLEEYPDSCFVEDVALLTPEVAVIAGPGAETRRGEEDHIVDAVRKYYPEDRIAFIKAPGTLEGGNVMMAGNKFYVGESERTNPEGFRQFKEVMEAFGHEAFSVPLKEFFHLKTGISYIENGNMLVMGELVDHPMFKDYECHVMPEGEEYAANSIWVNDVILVPEGYPKTVKMIEDIGYRVITVDTTEFRKIDGGLSCLSLRFSSLI